MKSRNILDDGVEWRDRVTRIALPIVLRRAIDGKPITYGKLTKEVRATGESPGIPRNYNHVAGKIGDICNMLRFELGEPLPPLNAIIVSEITGLPSHGVDAYLSAYYAVGNHGIQTPTTSNRDDYARQVMNDVYHYSKWSNVAQFLGVSVPPGDKIADREIAATLPDPSAFAGGGESADHHALKRWIAARPELFNSFGKFDLGRLEYRLMSGDRLDVLFSNDETMLAVEVKTLTAVEDEVKRGVFQCVKYRATLRATQLVNRFPPNAQAVLAMHGYREEVEALARFLRVSTVVVIPGRLVD